jgi:hypothetical protein
MESLRVSGRRPGCLKRGDSAFCFGDMPGYREEVEPQSSGKAREVSAPVPAPASIVLVATGLAGLGAYRGRKGRRDG